MSKTLVLAEKPSVGREIARVLGCRKAPGGYMESEKYVVTWALGHLVTLAEPEHYGDKYKNWSMDTLPMLPEKMSLKVIPETAKQFKVVKSQMQRPEVDSLVIATDAGREGELVARWIMEKAGFKKPVRRLWISSQTDKAIKEGFAKLKDGKEYLNLYRSAESRAEADWLVGLNATRALTCKYNAQLSAGRVQTPTLALVVAREREIQKFVPRDYYNVRADLGRFFVTWHDKEGNTGIFDRQKAEALAAKIRDGEFRVTDIKITEKKTPVPMLYDLTELQRDANKAYGLSPKETLNIMQSLYETHKALTYPRTDSRYLTEDIVPTLRDRLRAVSKGEFAPVVKDILSAGRKIAAACVNDSKVSDHHAIIPTEELADMIKLSSDEKRIYMMVVRRFLTVFYPEYRYRSIRAELSAEGESFSATGRTVVDKGWRGIFDVKDEDEDTEEEQALPELKKGQTFRCENVQLKSRKTSPPARYTEATLLSAMESPGKFIEDKKMKEFIGGGLGTPATRADIMEKLFNSFYMEKRGSSIYPTQKGIKLMELVPEDLKEPLLTAKWEMRLEAIKNGSEKKEKFISEIREYTSELVKSVAASDLKYVHDNLTKTPCPVCGKPMLKVKGKKGEMLVCQDRGCGQRQYISRESNVRCPQCHKRMEIFGEGEKRTYACVCGFRERVERFHEKSGGGAASKQDVQKFLTKQKKDEPAESALAKALAEALKKKS